MRGTKYRPRVDDLCTRLLSFPQALGFLKKPEYVSMNSVTLPPYLVWLVCRVSFFDAAFPDCWAPEGPQFIWVRHIAHPSALQCCAGSIQRWQVQYTSKLLSTGICHLYLILWHTPGVVAFYILVSVGAVIFHTSPEESMVAGRLWMHLRAAAFRSLFYVRRVLIK